MKNIKNRGKMDKTEKRRRKRKGRDNKKEGTNVR